MNLSKAAVVQRGRIDTQEGRPSDLIRVIKEALPTASRDALRPLVHALRRTKRDHLSLADLAYARPSFSQFGEDLFLAQHFAGRCHGFYVDVGALHPFFGSNTFLLYRSGWRGINVEPDPEGHRLLEKYRPRDLNLCVAVGTRPGEATFVRDGSFSGLEDDTYLFSDKDPGAERITVPVCTLKDILDRYVPTDRPVDILCVDCEGHDLDVLRSGDWTRHRPALVMVEWHGEPEDDKHPGVFLAEHGYRQIAERQLTRFFAPLS